VRPHAQYITGSDGGAEQLVSEETRLIRGGVLVGILVDDSLMVPTQGGKMCLEMAKKNGPVL